MRGIEFSGAVVLMLSLVAPWPVAAQGTPTARVTRATVVLETPRGDSVPVAPVTAGEVLDVLDRQGNWYLVSPAATAGAKWERGWIHASAVVLSGTVPESESGRRPRPRGRLMLRAFGQGGGTLFVAHDSFDAIVGNPFGLVFGGGGQVVFPNGVFAQVGVDRYRETGSRALVSGEQIFSLDTPARITVTPVLLSAGVRSPGSSRYAPYLGGGVGWHELTEDSPAAGSTERITRRKIGYHVFGGSEFPLGRWLALGAEVQWATVPDAMGETGITAVFQEDDLGGTTFRLKVIVGY